MSAEPPAPVAPRPGRVLIVDDEPKNRKLLEAMLTAEGLVLQTAGSGEEAFAMVAKQAPDLILLDVMMPGIDGFQVATAIKSDIATRNIRIIMVTALDDRDARMQGLSAGAEDFLSKPVDRAELIARVRSLLHLKAVNEELDTRCTELELAKAVADVALTEAREARMMAEHANSAKTLFLRAMSHELRTPLNAITGYTELLELGIRGTVNPKQIQDLGRIKRAAAYLTRLINDILAVARLEGARPLNFVSIAVNPVLDEVEGLCALLAKAGGLKLTVTPCDPDINVTADAERFQQILLNLLTNAIKFTPPEGSIAVTCECGDGLARLHVKDSGIGIRPVDIDRVFEPFVQIDRHLTKAAQQGVGLGLSISRDLARAMHGDLTLQSTEGVGSTFTLTLPIASEIAPASSVAA